MLKEGKIYVPKDKELRVEIIQLYHDVLMAEHGGRWKMMELVTRNYWWLGVTKDIEKYVEGYDMYQRMKNRTEALAGKLMANEILEKYMAKILFGWDDRKFENKYLKRLERNWWKQKSVSLEEKP